MSEPVRFPANVPYEKWPNLYNVFAAMSGNDFAEAERRWKAHTQDCLDAAGAIQMGYEAYTPPSATVKPTVPPKLDVGATLPWFPSPSGQINATQANGNGKVSCSASSGGVPCWISFDPSFPNNESQTSYGAGATGYLAVAKGQTFYFKHDGGGTQDMRASIESL